MSTFSFSNNEKAIPVRICQEIHIKYNLAVPCEIQNLGQALIGNLKMTQRTIFLLNRLIENRFD